MITEPVSKARGEEADEECWDAESDDAGRPRICDYSHGSVRVAGGARCGPEDPDGGRRGHGLRQARGTVGGAGIADAEEPHACPETEGREVRGGGGAGGARPARRGEEFVKRAAFARLASLAGHDNSAGDAAFVASLLSTERAATDERNFVKKAVSRALRRIGRRNAALNAAAVAVARRLVDSTNAAARWEGKDALKELTSPAVVRRLKA